jgi:hypothetical protein
LKLKSFRLPRFASLLVLVFPIVHDSDHGRSSSSCYFHQVEAAFLSRRTRIFDRDDPNLLAAYVNQPDRAYPDLIVHAGLVLIDSLSPFLWVQAT